jgi:lipopolysaccharide heptosyltransferase II
MIVDSHLVKSILVVKLRAIGDVLLSTVVLKSLRSAFPNARIDFLTERPSREVVEGNPDVDSLMVFDGKRESGAGLILKVRRRRYDMVIDLFGNPRSALVTLGSGARYRVGYRFGWRKYCYNLVTEPRGDQLHNTDFNLDALRRIEIPVLESLPQFPVPGEAQDFAGAFFEKENLVHKKVIALNPGGGWSTKRWRIPQFAALGDRIAASYGAEILIIWGPGEETMAGEIRRLMSARASLIPPSNLKQLGAILSRCALVVTNDSGPMHIAAAVGTPVVAIFGPTNPELQGPVGVPSEIVQNLNLVCLGCNYTKCPIGNPCMEELGVEAVFQGVEKLSTVIVQSPSAEGH